MTVVEFKTLSPPAEAVYQPKNLKPGREGSGNVPYVNPCLTTIFDGLQDPPLAFNIIVYSFNDQMGSNTVFDDIFVELPDNADLPKVKKHVRFKIGKNVQNIISLQNGDPLLMMSNVGKGKVFVMSTSLDDEYSDLANHALFVPLMYKMALIGGNISELSYTLGIDKTLNINDVSLNVDDRISLKSDNAMYEIFPMIENRNGINYISFFEDLPSSGFYDVYKNDEYVKTVAWNDDRNESEMSFFSEEKLTEYFKNNDLNLLATIDYEDVSNGDVVETIVNQSSLWKMFVVVALMALLIEILILRFWK